MQQETKISDYALIGNCRSAALVSKYGSVDWCCLPEFDSPAIFSRLLDVKSGGHFSIAPVDGYSSEQCYLTDTNVVSTVFITKTGRARILDCFVAGTEEEKHISLFPDHEILRTVEVIEGLVKFRMEYMPRIYYGKYKPRLKDRKGFGIKFSEHENSFTLLSTLNNIKVGETSCIATFTLQKGEKELFSLSCNSQDPCILPELRGTGAARLARTIAYWKNWISQCRYEGTYNEPVRRSALALKLLTHAPSGAIIAAPTCALPEEPGGTRNWDYRYCWLRDASFTTRALIKLGFESEAHAYMNWILHATQLTRPTLLVVYSVFGNSDLPEKNLSWLSGYRNSRPVRIGNEASAQLQLDLYGEVLDAVYSYANITDKFTNGSRKFIIGLGDAICKFWEKPDNGIWEVRSSPAHHTHSKVMAWAGLDRLIKLAATYGWKNAQTEKYETVKSRIRQEIEEHAFNTGLRSYTAHLHGNSLDASTLVFPLVGYCEATSPRMITTRRAIMERLTRNDLLYRYQESTDGIKGGEGAFGICNFWLVENLAKAGEISEAVKTFEAMLKYASPSGLFSEEINPESSELLGNYPQGFTHIGLINAALSINESQKKEAKV